MCVQRFDDSLDPAIRITYRISRRSSSLWEPRDPSLKDVVSGLCVCVSSVSSCFSGVRAPRARCKRGVKLFELNTHGKGGCASVGCQLRASLSRGTGRAEDAPIEGREPRFLRRPAGGPPAWGGVHRKIGAGFSVRCAQCGAARWVGAGLGLPRSPRYPLPWQEQTVSSGWVWRR